MSARHRRNSRRRKRGRHRSRNRRRSRRRNERRNPRSGGRSPCGSRAQFLIGQGRRCGRKAMNRIVLLTLISATRRIHSIRSNAKKPMDRVSKGLFALASYNAGPKKIQKLRKQAAAQGYDRNRWFNNVEIIAVERNWPRDGSIRKQYLQVLSRLHDAYRTGRATPRRQNKVKAVTQ